MEMVRIRVLSAGQDPGGKMKADLCGYLTLSWFFLMLIQDLKETHYIKKKECLTFLDPKEKTPVILEPGEDPYFLDLNFEV